MARKKPIDPAVKEQVLNILSAGATMKDAAAYVGVTDDTLRNWMKADSEFSASVGKARVQGKIACVGTIRQAAKSNWQAAAWFLERSDPENWGRTTKLLLKVEPDLLKRLQATADASGIDLAQVFEAMINEFGSISVGDSEAES